MVIAIRITQYVIEVNLAEASQSHLRTQLMQLTKPQYFTRPVILSSGIRGVTIGKDGFTELVSAVNGVNDVGEFYAFGVRFQEGQ